MELKEQATIDLERLLDLGAMYDRTRYWSVIKLMTIKYEWPQPRGRSAFEYAILILSRKADVITDKEKEFLLKVMEQG
jgi:hypothetical protein